MKAGSVLDVGAGTGRHSLFLGRLGFMVTALEIDHAKAAQIRTARSVTSLPITVVESSLDAFETTQSFDVVLATMSLHFLDPDDVGRNIRKLQKYTKCDGLNVVSVLTTQNSGVVRPHLFSPGELRSYYSDASWTIREYEEALSENFFSRSQQKLTKQHRAVLIATKACAR